MSFSRLEYANKLAEGLVLFAISVYITHVASKFAAVKASNPVEDIILSNTPVLDFEVLFVHVAIAMTLLVVFLTIFYRLAAPFILKSVALFITIRACFVSLTHMGPYPTRLELDSKLLDFITSGNDLFFSGHTGLPFLVALIFWKHLYIRILFLVTSIGFGIVVLLSHLHYSIDVFAAFFITYSIYHLSQKLFRRDFEYAETALR